MNWLLVFKSGLKYFIIAVAGVLVAALGVALTGFKPGSPVEIVLFQYLVAPMIAGLIGLIKNAIQHYGDKPAK